MKATLALPVLVSCGGFAVGQRPATAQTDRVAALARQASDDAAALAAALSMAGRLALLFAVDKTIGLRVSEDSAGERG